jgi:broad specificity phosphatase PhoE
MTTIYIVRHAEKAKGDFYNPQLRHQDEPISPNGRREAQELWSYFADKQISAIYISEYIRTAQTVEYIANQLKLTPIIDIRLNEIDNGLFEGKSADELERAYPEIWQAFRQRKQDFRFPEGETGEEACCRIANVLEEKRIAHDLRAIILVSHEGLIRLLMCHILNIPVYHFQVDFCGMMEIVYQPEYHHWKLLHFNQVIH